MEDSFDPYRKWLGIPPEDRPPHHYRLLGIEPFESDADVIANAADGRMAQIKIFQVGEHSGLSQRILNELAAAKLCLLNREKKVQYDHQLRQRLGANSHSAAGASAAAPRKPTPKPAAPRPAAKTPAPDEAALPRLAHSSVSSYVAGRSRKRRPLRLAVAIGAGSAVLVFLVVYLVSGFSHPGRVQPPGAPHAEPRVPVSEAARPLASADLRPTAPEPIGAPAGPQNDPVEQPADADPALRQEGPPRLLGDLLDPEDREGPDEGASDTPTAGQTEANPPGADDANRSRRLAVPDRASRQEVEKRVREIFKKEFAGARTSDQKLALAARLFDQGLETPDDPIARFVLLQLACEMSADEGELASALNAVEQMQLDYEIDTWGVKAYVLEKVVGAFRPGPSVAADARKLVDTALQLADEAVAADEFDQAGRLVKSALSVARKMRNTPLIRRIASRGKEIEALGRRFAGVGKALERLAEDPADGDANLKAGQWYCFTKGQWDKGLPLLAKGTDPILSELARQEAASPAEPKQQAELADRWRDLAEKESSEKKSVIRARARHWYEQALPNLKGLEKVRVEKALEELAAAEAPKQPKTPGVVAEGNVALASNGTTVTGRIINPAALIDGNSTRYTSNTGFAWSVWPCEWTVSFKEVYQLQEIRLKLYDRTKRHYRYIIAASADGKKYTLLVDRSQGEWSGWQQVQFPARPVRAIKVMGLFGSENNQFHVVELEAYCTAQPPLGK